MVDDGFDGGGGDANLRSESATAASHGGRTNFVFDKRYYNVLEVNKTNYEKCNDQNFITNITRGGRDVFELKQVRPYYFLSSGGYCFHGMKLAINVEEYVLPPAAAPTINGGYMNNDSQIILTIVLGITLVCALLMKLY
ncbi:hypothetical protein CsSME_00004186 [Camellia sinensis var. sinensis]